MTDEQIIKALECCKKDDCDNCPNDFGNCYANLAGYALDLINRQQAEIERLNNSAKQWEDTAKDLFIGKQTAKAEAIKEFAERLKKLARPFPFFIIEAVCGVTVTDIDNLVKEMEGLPE